MKATYRQPKTKCKAVDFEALLASTIPGGTGGGPGEAEGKEFFDDELELEDNASAKSVWDD